MLNEKEVLKKLSEIGIQACPTDVKKNNNVVLRGITIGAGKIRPTLYLQYYDEICDFIVDAVRALHDLPEFDDDLIQDWDSIKDKLRIRISKHPEVDLVKEAFCDIKMMAYIKLSEEANIPVRRDLFERYGKDIGSFFKLALENTAQYEGAEIIDLGELVNSITGRDMTEEFEQIDNVLHVLTNKSRHFGAAAVLYFDELPKRFFMLPSSVHETILVYPTDTFDIINLSMLVQEVNKTIDQKDILSDHAYLYDDGLWSFDYEGITVGTF